MTPTPQWYEADSDDADRHPRRVPFEAPRDRAARLALTLGQVRETLRLRTEALGRVQRERDELAAEVERLRADKAAEAENARLRETLARLEAVVVKGERAQALNREALAGGDFAGMLNEVPTIRDFRTALSAPAADQPAESGA